MKKTIAALCSILILSVSAGADFLRIEMGGGVWEQKPSGYVIRTDGEGLLSLKGTYRSDEEKSSEFYAWILLKHPIPIIPNLRLEYLSLSDEGKTRGSVNGLTIPLETSTTIDAKMYDVIPYYNLLDNTFWLTLDLGLDIKFIDSRAEIKPKINIPGFPDFPGYSSTDSTFVPLIYLRGRVQIPETDLGFEATIKAITDGTDTAYDMLTKIDYTFGSVPTIQPGVELGYRVIKLKVDDGAKTQADLDYRGVYAGILLRF